MVGFILPLMVGFWQNWPSQGKVNCCLDSVFHTISVNKAKICQKLSCYAVFLSK